MCGKIIENSVPHTLLYYMNLTLAIHLFVVGLIIVNRGTVPCVHLVFGVFLWLPGLPRLPLVCRVLTVNAKLAINVSERNA